MDDVGGGEEDDLFDSLSSSDDSSGSDPSSASDFMEDATSSSSSSSPSSVNQLVEGPLYEMSSLMAQLPFKRGLSKHYEGKSQSFTSLAAATCLADLAKPENPYNKRLKSSKSYAGNLDCHRSYPPRGSISKAISKKSPKSSCGASLIRRNNSFLSNKPPIPTQKNV
ncbi:hypothetical protein EJ110_NYTH19954 [Nymphaea thermarum]|nr:hypothetical protein EJ110_NYTH19954 [Nymphaea thermarum]